jgi:hypothetical protein
MHSAFGGKLSVLRGCRSRLQAVLYGFGLSLCALRRMLSALRLFLSSFRSRLSALAATPSEEQGQRYEGRATPCPKLAMPSPNLAMLCPYLGVLSRFVMILCEGAAPIREQSRGYRAFRPMLPSSRKGLCALVARRDAVGTRGDASRVPRGALVEACDAVRVTRGALVGPRDAVRVSRDANRREERRWSLQWTASVADDARQGGASR